MEERHNQFEYWLINEKQFSEQKANSICSLFQRINSFLLTKESGRYNLFEITDTKTYNSICNNWLTGKLASAVLKKDAVEFRKHRKLFAEFLSSDYFLTALSEKVEYPEVINEINEAELIDIVAKFEEIEKDLSLETEGETEEIIGPPFIVKTFEQTIFGKCREVVSTITTEKLTKNNLEKEKCIAFFDVVNECFEIDTEKTSKILDINSYSVVNGKAFRHDDKYLGDFSDYTSTYKTIFGLSHNISDRIIEKSIKDSLNNYKAKHLYCLLPDLLDDFNKEIKSQINYNGKKIFLIPKSVALLFSLLKKNKISANNEYYVADYDGDELSLTCLHTREDEEDKSIRIVRKGLCRIDCNHINYKYFAQSYLTKYCDKYKISLTDNQKKNIIDSKAILRLCKTKQPILISHNDNYCIIKFDPIIFQKLSEEYRADLPSLKGVLKNKKNLLVINSFFESDYTYLDLFDGCNEIHGRIINNESLWDEYLPQLSLEVIQDGHFEEIKLIDNNQYRDVLKVLNSEEIIPVEGTVTLGEGKAQYRLPLKREIIGSHNSKKEACLKHTSFPLSKNVQVKMEIRYKYGDEDSYKLIFYPLSSDAPFERIENVWENVEEINEISIPKIQSVSQQMTNEEIQYVINGVDQAIDRVNKILRGWQCPREITNNPHTNVEESQIFNSLNKLYTQRRKFFSTYMCQHNAKVKHTIKNMFNTKLLSNMYNIMSGMPSWKKWFATEEYPVVKGNIERILVDMGAIYALRVDDSISAELIKEIIDYFVKNNKLGQLVPLSRCIINDRYGIFDHITDRIIQKGSKKKLNIEDLRTISANCWQSKEWLKNLFYAKNGQQAISYIIQSVTNFILEYKVDDIKHKCDYNPRAIRDVLELLLFCTRANEYLFKTSNQVYFDPNSELVKNLIEKIKLIDYYMDKYKGNLHKDKPFYSRLNANITKKELYRVNDITYMLIQTLSGKESVELIGFIDD